MQVVIPLSRETVGRPLLSRIKTARLILLILQYEVDMTGRRHLFSNTASDLAQNISFTVILDGMDGVEPQPVQAKVIEPIQRVLNHKLPHDRRAGGIEIHGSTPG